MSRRDYINDPAAPAANSLVPAASVVVVNDEGLVLLHRRTDNNQWALPGGVMEIGESLAECARREVREETGLDVQLQGIVGIYSDPNHVFAYDDGEVRQEFSICFHARPTGGTLTVSDESHELRYFTVQEIDELPMVESIRLRIRDFLRGGEPAIR